MGVQLKLSSVCLCEYFAFRLGQSELLRGSMVSASFLSQGSSCGENLISHSINEDGRCGNYLLGEHSCHTTAQFHPDNELIFFNLKQ